MRKKTVGVVIPYFNRHETIEATLASIEHQTLSPDAIVIVDDGSSQSSHDYLIDCVKGKYEVSVIRQRNKGVSSARNAGLAKLNTDYVAFLDSDDSWRKGHLERSVDVLNQNPNLIAVHSRYSVVSDEPSIKRRMQVMLEKKLAAWVREGELPDEKTKVYHLQSELASYLLLNGKAAMLTSSVVLANSALDDCVFDTLLVHGEDFDFFNRLASFGDIAYIDIDSVDYVLHGGNTINLNGTLPDANKLIAQAKSMEKRLMYCNRAEEKLEVMRTLSNRYYLIAQSLSNKDDFKCALLWYRASFFLVPNAQAFKHLILNALLPNALLAKLY